MDYSIRYDKTNPKSIEQYAKELIGKTFEEVLSRSVNAQLLEDEAVEQYGKKARKGGLGNLLEREYFGYEPNSSPEPDFPEAGVELKVTPYEINKNGEIRAGERLVLGMISYDNPIEADFYSSHAWQKCKLILLIYYLRNKAVKSNLQYSIDYVTLFTPSEKDLRVIERDYEIIQEKISRRFPENMAIVLEKFCKEEPFQKIYRTENPWASQEHLRQVSGKNVQSLSSKQASGKKSRASAKQAEKK